MAQKEKEETEDKIVVVEDSEIEEKAEEKEQKSGELDSSEEDESEKKPKKIGRKRGNDGQKRVNELWMQRKEAEEAARIEKLGRTAAEAKNSEYEKITASALEEGLNTKRELLKERLMRAREEGNHAKETELTSELTKVEAQAAQIDRYKIENQINKQPAAQEPPQQRAQRDLSVDELYDVMPPAGKSWIDQNRDWYDPESENHDPEKYSDVKYYAQQLERQLVNQGRGAEIATRGYFNRLNDYINKNWSEDVPNDEEEEAPVTQQKKNYAAPVGNRGNNSGAPPGRKEYKITQSEKEFALSLDTKDKTGKSLSDAEKIKRFISLKENVPSGGPISIKSIRNKGA